MHERYMSKDINVEYVLSKQQVADILKKLLSRDYFN